MWGASVERAIEILVSDRKRPKCSNALYNC
jgi:hypothetical protein